MRLFTKIIGLLLVVFLTACGGGGGSPGLTPNTVSIVNTGAVSTPTSVITATTVITAADFVAELDKASITNTGTDTAVLTVVVVDKNRNVLADVPISVSVNSGSIFAASSTATDSSGRFTGKITIGSDKTNRVISAVITVNGMVKTVSLAVVSVSSVILPVVVSAASDFIFELDKTLITNSGADSVLLTVKVVDQNRNLVGNVPVAVSVNSGAVFAASGNATDSTGKFSGNITIGGDKSNRTINATITVNNIVKVASILVTGSQITLTPLPATPEPGNLVTLNLGTFDSVGSPIQNVGLVLSGTAGAAGSVSTDLSGARIFTFSAPAVAGTYTVVVTGSGVSTTKNIQVVATGVAGVPSAVGPINASSLSPQPTAISPNVAGSTLNRAKLSARFLTGGNVGLANMRVRFEILQPALGSGELISTGNSTVYSDLSGVAEADYISGSRSSPTNGVLVRACYKLTDFLSPTDCPNSVNANLTVAGTPLSISISDDNTLQKGLGGIAYIKTFLIQVNDSAGVAVPSAIVTPSVDITHYGKGSFYGVYPLNVAPDITLQSLPSATTAPTASFSFVTTVPNTTPTEFVTVSVPGTNVWCKNEDLNRNGFLDSLEDVNGDNKIQPAKAEIIVSYVSGNKTDINGQMLLQVNYGQNMGRWLAYTLRATTGVAGSEGDTSKSYITDVLLGDLSNGSFLTPPFGSKNCSTVN